MNTFEIDKEFFVIDSEMLDEVKTQLYGFCIVNSQLVENADSLVNTNLNGDGAYVYIQRLQDRIIIKQDFIGSYGLYLYKNENYFALSNSFIRLVDHVKKAYPISFNQDYANFFIASSLCSVAYSETLVSEIEMLDRSAVIEIDIIEKKLNISYLDYEENTVVLNSDEGMKILDSWYYKWTDLIRNLSAGHNNIQIDLSGGFDSRITLALMLGSDVDMNHIFVNSIDDKLHTHAEDFEIASAISKHYGFGLNNGSAIVDKAIYHTAEDILNISFYLKLGFHKQMYLKLNHRTPTRHYFGGSGGECIRSYWNMSEQEYIENMVKRCNVFSVSTRNKFEKSTRTLLKSAFDKINNKFESYGRKIKPSDMTLNLYRETRCRNHFGKDVLENYYGGSIKYCPLLDVELHKLKLDDKNCSDKNLLMAVIFDRYSRQLLDFKFEGNRCIDNSTIQYAKKINEKFPFRKKETSKFNDVYNSQASVQSDYYKTIANNSRITKEEMTGLVERAFYSKKVRSAFEFLYDKDVYEYIVSDIRTKKYQPLENAYVAIAISKVFQDVCSNESMYCTTISDTVNNYLLSTKEVKESKQTLKEHPYLDYYITARIDIKNQGNDFNNLEFISISDEYVKITTPKWFEKNGKGYVVESKQGSIEIVFKCVNSGKLQIALRGRDVRDKSGTKIPFWIDYQEMQINDKMVFNDVKAIWHDKPFKFDCNVKDGEIVKLKFAWSPHDERNLRVYQ